MATAVRREYSEADQEEGFHALALNHGRAAQASRWLKKQPDKPQIPANTLTKWKTKQPARYIKVKEEVLPQVYAEVAETNEEIAALAASIEMEALERAQALMQADELTPNQILGVAKHATISKGVAVDKSRAIRGDDVVPAEKRQPDQVLKALKRIAPALFIEGEAVEIAEAPTLVPSDALQGLQPGAGSDG